MNEKELNVFNISYYKNDGSLNVEEKDIDKVFLYFDNLSELGFTNLLNELQRPILKIQYQNKAIYRKFKQGAGKGITKNQIGISNHDKRLLGLQKIDDAVVIVSLANVIGLLKYYYFNPNQDLRFAFKIVLLGIPLAILLNLISSLLFEFLKSIF